jgi:hypothetical protein
MNLSRIPLMFLISGRLIVMKPFTDMGACFCMSCEYVRVLYVCMYDSWHAHQHSCATKKVTLNILIHCNAWLQLKKSC